MDYNPPGFGKPRGHPASSQPSAFGSQPQTQYGPAGGRGRGGGGGPRGGGRGRGNLSLHLPHGHAPRAQTMRLNGATPAPPAAGTFGTPQPALGFGQSEPAPGFGQSQPAPAFGPPPSAFGQPAAFGRPAPAVPFGSAALARVSFGESSPAFSTASSAPPPFGGAKMPACGSFGPAPTPPPTTLRDHRERAPQRNGRAAIIPSASSSIVPDTDVKPQREDRFNDAPQGNRYMEMKNGREALRKHFIEAGKMADPSATYHLKDAIRLVPECRDMCPEFERHEREFQKALHFLEKIPGTDQVDHQKAVKRYRRSAAGDPPPLPSDIRPPPVLNQTLDYLIHTIIGQYGINNTDVHVFVFDRTRSVRNDLVLQNERGPAAIAIHERIARYHAICCYQLFGQAQVSLQQEIEQLRKALQSLIEFYAEARTQRGEIYPNEPEFQAYQLLAYMHKSDLPSHAHYLPDRVFAHPYMQQALRIQAAYRAGFSARFFSLIQSPETPFVMACVAHMSFATVRSNAIKSLQSGLYFIHPSTDWVPLSDLAPLLGYGSPDDVLTELQVYGIQTKRMHDGSIGAKLGKIPEPAIADPTGKPRGTRMVPGVFKTNTHLLAALKPSTYLLEPKRHRYSDIDLIDGAWTQPVDAPLSATMAISPMTAQGMTPPASTEFAVAPPSASSFPSTCFPSAFRSSASAATPNRPAVSVPAPAFASTPAPALALAPAANPVISASFAATALSPVSSAAAAAAAPMAVRPTAPAASQPPPSTLPRRPDPRRLPTAASSVATPAATASAAPTRGSASALGATPFATTPSAAPPAPAALPNVFVAAPPTAGPAALPMAGPPASATASAGPASTLVALTAAGPPSLAPPAALSSLPTAPSPRTALHEGCAAGRRTSASLPLPQRSSAFEGSPQAVVRRIPAVEPRLYQGLFRRLYEDVVRGILHEAIQDHVLAHASTQMTTRILESWLVYTMRSLFAKERVVGHFTNVMVKQVLANDVRLVCAQQFAARALLARHVAVWRTRGAQSAENRRLAAAWRANSLVQAAGIGLGADGGFRPESATSPPSSWTSARADVGLYRLNAIWHRDEQRQQLWEPLPDLFEHLQQWPGLIERLRRMHAPQPASDHAVASIKTVRHLYVKTIVGSTVDLDTPAGIVHPTDAATLIWLLSKFVPSPDWDARARRLMQHLTGLSRGGAPRRSQDPATPSVKTHVWLQTAFEIDRDYAAAMPATSAFSVRYLLQHVCITHAASPIESPLPTRQAQPHNSEAGPFSGTTMLIYLCCTPGVHESLPSYSVKERSRLYAYLSRLPRYAQTAVLIVFPAVPHCSGTVFRDQCLPGFELPRLQAAGLLHQQPDVLVLEHFHQQGLPPASLDQFPASDDPDDAQVDAQGVLAWQQQDRRRLSAAVLALHQKAPAPPHLAWDAKALCLTLPGIGEALAEGCGHVVYQLQSRVRATWKATLRRSTAMSPPSRSAAWNRLVTFSLQTLSCSPYYVLMLMNAQVACWNAWLDRIHAALLPPPPSSPAMSALAVVAWPAEEDAASYEDDVPPITWNTPAMLQRRQRAVERYRLPLPAGPDDLAAANAASHQINAILTAAVQTATRGGDGRLASLATAATSAPLVRPLLLTAKQRLDAWANHVLRHCAHGRLSPSLSLRLSGRLTQFWAAVGRDPLSAAATAATGSTGGGAWAQLFRILLELLLRWIQDDPDVTGVLPTLRGAGLVPSQVLAVAQSVALDQSAAMDEALQRLAVTAHVEALDAALTREAEAAAVLRAPVLPATPSMRSASSRRDIAMASPTPSAMSIASASTTMADAVAVDADHDGAGAAFKRARLDSRDGASRRRPSSPEHSVAGTGGAPSIPGSPWLPQHADWDDGTYLTRLLAAARADLRHLSASGSVAGSPRLSAHGSPRFSAHGSPRFSAHGSPRPRGAMPGAMPAYIGSTLRPAGTAFGAADAMPLSPMLADPPMPRFRLDASVGPIIDPLDGPWIQPTRQ